MATAPAESTLGLFATTTAHLIDRNVDHAIGEPFPNESASNGEATEGASQADQSESSISSLKPFSKPEPQSFYIQSRPLSVNPHWEQRELIPMQAVVFQRSASTLGPGASTSV